MLLSLINYLLQKWFTHRLE